MSKYIDSEAFFKLINTTLSYKDTSYPDASVYNGAISDVADMLTHFPAADVAPRWIPVTEKLPDLWDERYLVSLAWGGVGTMEYKSTGFHNYGSFSPVPIETVTAWMPLPEPYKEGEQNG